MNMLDKVSCHFHYSVGRNRQFHKFVRKPKSSESPISHEVLKTLLQECKSVADQIEVFQSYVKLDHEDKALRYSVCHELENILRPYFPRCSIHLVGSSVNGFGVKGCDIDLSLQFSNLENEENEIAEDTHCGVFAEDLELDEISAPKIQPLSPKQQLFAIRKILESSDFEGPFSVIPGICPILHFTYRKLSCDLSLDNKSALYGTNLMRFCEKLDSRVAPLFQIISYWAKGSHLIGGPLKFKTYAFFLLLVYFLQTRTPPVLPPVDIILDKTDFQKHLGNWSYDISKYVNSFSPSENMQTAEELLREFFFFYSNFDLSWVICPRSSDVMNICFFKPKDGEDSGFELNTVCIQDPIDLHWNVTKGVSYKYCKKFGKSLLSVCEIYQHTKNIFLSPQNWGLISIFDSKLNPDLFISNDCVTIQLPLPISAVNLSSMESFEKEIQNVAKYIFHILDYCLLFQCKFLDMTNETELFVSHNNSTCKDKIPSQYHFSEHLIYCASCIASNAWYGRNSWNVRRTGTNFNKLDTERHISKLIVQYRENEMEKQNSFSLQQKKDEEKEKFSFLCECSSIHEVSSISLLVKLKPTNSDKFLRGLAVFLKEYIPYMCRYL
ncbi:speckle targeted PIP5K1A-regulated poly(A) polymerase-like isoform X2 [Stegodyphus dumicola]|uniref:speckle targeted PIP5K1A-regulated poly(A) polymerase-like isoform X2 n=1 Tax=Stegodyphus dumicola TaxID=202533 RepID=UPI0015AA3B98|nr:speckle targeted PIP5K1A-regulated poly(A) polymerase-like isoform X2 [Stegodyphus dumicola]